MTIKTIDNQVLLDHWVNDQLLPTPQRKYSSIGFQVKSWGGPLKATDQKIVLLLRYTQFWQKIWYYLRVFLGWIRTKSPCLVDLKHRITIHQNIESPAIRKLANELRPLEIHQIDQAATICLNTLEAVDLQIFQKQLEVLYERLVTDFGSEKAEQILANPKLVPEKQAQVKMPLPKGRIEQIILCAKNYFYNIEEIKKLEDELRENLAPSILSSLVQKLSHENYLNGHNRISNDILNEVKQLGQKQHVENLLNRIEIACKTWLPGDEMVIKKHFNVDAAIALLPEEEQRTKLHELKKIAVCAFLKKRLEKSQHLSNEEGKEFDLQLLDLCGHGIDNQKNEDKAALHECISDFINMELHKIAANCDSVPTIEFLQNELTKLPTLFRVQCATSFTSQAQIEKFMLLRGHAWEFYQNKKAPFQLQKEKMIPDSFPSQHLPLHTALSKKRALNFANSYLQVLILNSIKHHLLEFYKRNSKEEFHSTLKRDFGRFLEINDEDLLANTRKYIESLRCTRFLQKYAPYIQREFAQGYKLDGSNNLIEDDQEILGDGVCCALCRRLEIKSTKDPQSSFEDLSLNEIESMDRYYQAKFSYVPYQLIDHETLKKEGLADKKDEKIGGLQAKSGEALDQFVISFKTYFTNSIYTKLAKSHGNCNLAIYFKNKTAHALYLRADPNSGKYWLYDPNLGYINIPNSETAYEELLNTFIDLCNQFYDKKVTAVSVFQIN